ncbi:hypothetical protein BB559_003927 [Furculomyces boomerangus]|uniref:BAR domain-containing protein n=2 Tax=Harpellales TaxID=61421 RepID=A0A2T9YI33_9FUNG|nr:hypothetical protein BB559_003927 [Furculomyces boomerangus]PVZ99117.1 hypothetical protein BB558_004876 [Smittium angustum]
MDQFTKLTQGISQNFSPFAEKMGANFTQLKQLASEKLGATNPITELPREYVELESRFEGVRIFHAEMVKISKTFTQSEGDTELKQLKTQFIGITNTLGDRFNSLTGSTKAAHHPQASSQSSIGVETEPQTIQHAISSVCIENSEKIGLEEPLGASLYKFGTASDKIGDSRIRMNNAIREDVVAVLQSETLQLIAVAQQSRKDVQGSRLALDALKSAHKTAVPAKESAIRAEVEKAEDIFVTTVEDAMKHMRQVLESPVIIQAICSFASAQLEFYKESEKILTELIPDLDEIKLTQDALYGHSEQ